MAVETPTVEFFDGIAEEISAVSLRRDRSTGDRIALLSFERMKSIEAFQSFRSRFSKALRLTDCEGVITIEPRGVKFIFGGPEGDDLRQVECTLAIDREDHWQRFMRFMHRYAQANGLMYGEPDSPQLRRLQNSPRGWLHLLGDLGRRQLLPCSILTSGDDGTGKACGEALNQQQLLY